MTRKQIERRTIELQQKLGLANWDIVILFDTFKKPKSATNNFPAVAHTTSQCQYKLGTIRYNPKTLRLIDDSVIVHELLHVLMSPLIQIAEDTSKEKESIRYYNEMITSELERIIVRGIL